jgi:hypothetical protein
MRKKIGCLVLSFKGVILLVLLLAWSWGCLALFYSGPGPEWARTIYAVLFCVLLPASFLVGRSFLKGLLCCLALFAIHITWWQTLQSTNQKDWAADVAHISHGEISENSLTMYNVRNFRYIDDKISEERWETRTYDLNKVQGLDLFLSYWGSDHIAHTILSWDFGGDQHLAISIETRKDTSQEYSAIKGFFKQFELSYVAADERDIIRLRTNYRKERVYVYRLKESAERARALLENYLAEMNKLVTEPEFYNALTRNCTTTIHLHANAASPGARTPMDWRILASGHVDELLYERGMVAQNLAFSELRQQSRIDQRMQTYGEDHFSEILRRELPQFKNLE